MCLTPTSIFFLSSNPSYQPTVLSRTSLSPTTIPIPTLYPTQTDRFGKADKSSKSTRYPSPRPTKADKRDSLAPTQYTTVSPTQSKAEKSISTKAVKAAKSARPSEYSSSPSPTQGKATKSHSPTTHSSSSSSTQSKATKSLSPIANTTLSPTQIKAGKSLSPTAGKAGKSARPFDKATKSHSPTTHLILDYPSPSTSTQGKATKSVSQPTSSQSKAAK